MLVREECANDIASGDYPLGRTPAEISETLEGFNCVDPWKKLGIEPVGDQYFRKRFEMQFKEEEVMRQSYSGLHPRGFVDFLESFYWGCIIDSQPVPDEFRSAAIRIGLELD